MNQQQPDKLFRDKLEHFSRPAPAGSWEKMEARLDKKSIAAMWWRVAASVVLLAAATYALWTFSRPSPGNPQQANTDKRPAGDHRVVPHAPLEATGGAAHQEPSGETTAPANMAAQTTEKLLRDDRTRQDSLRASSNAPSGLAGVARHETVNTDTASPTAATSAATTMENETLPIAAQQEPLADVPTQPEALTLIFTAEETDDYMSKNFEDEATDGDKKPSTFKKLLRKAQDLKNNQDPVGELRQMKNEILALNFKNEKRGQIK